MRATIRNNTVLLLACGTLSACAREPQTASFVTMLGASDTVAAERYTRSGDVLSGVSVVAYPRATMRAYEVTFGADGRVSRVHLASGAPGAEPGTVADFTYAGDSVTAEVRRDTTTQRYTVDTQGARPLPFFEDLYVFWDLSLGRAMESGADSTTIGALAGRGVLPLSFHRRGAETADFTYPEWGTIHASFDGDRLVGLDMTGTTSKYTVARVPSVDVDQLAVAWAARAQPGALSPRDTAAATVGAAHVMVDYGRPSMRGREVFGGIVPWGEVWRLGANAATQLVTDRPLVLVGTQLPAGTYSLWCIPNESSWTLVVNGQHGQWGTQYDESQDVARIPLDVGATAAPVERFTTEVTDAGGGRGTIAFLWENTRASVSFTVR
jgi:hypothetical protein